MGNRLLHDLLDDKSIWHHFTRAFSANTGIGPDPIYVMAPPPFLQHCDLFKSNR